MEIDVGTLTAEFNALERKPADLDGAEEAAYVQDLLADGDLAKGSR